MADLSFNDYIRQPMKTMNGERSIEALIRDYHKDCSRNSADLDYLMYKYTKRGYAIYFEGYGPFRGFINHLERIGVLPNLRIDKEELLSVIRNHKTGEGYIYIDNSKSRDDVLICIAPISCCKLESFRVNAHYWFSRNRQDNGVYEIIFNHDGTGFKCTTVVDKCNMNSSMQQMEFPEMRYRHCYAVGRKMYDYARNVLNRPENYCRELFVLGNIHDMGYEFESTLNGHGLCLSEALKSSYKYSFALEAHSIESFENAKEELILLYWADATTKGDGTYCTYAERIEDLSKRYGPASKEVELQLKIVQFLKSKGYKDLY